MPDKQRAPKVRHTPGPWVIHPDDQHAILRGSYLVADNVRTPQDARLIAAAPELLEALKEMLTAFSMEGALNVDGMKRRTDAKKGARAAIAKATGGAQ